MSWIKYLKRLLTGIVSVNDETDNFFKVDKNDYVKLVGKSFINNKLGVVVKVLGIPKGNESRYWTPKKNIDNGVSRHRQILI